MKCEVVTFYPTRHGAAAENDSKRLEELISVRYSEGWHLLAVVPLGALTVAEGSFRTSALIFTADHIERGRDE